jgi:choline dehydrogenase-like flavoprotein
MSTPHYAVVVIGTGFGGTMTALPLARHLQEWNAQHPTSKRTVLLLERGTWWTTPVSTVQDKEVKTYDFLANENRQPVQHWAPQNHFRGFIDFITRCRRRPGNEDGLIEVTQPGRTTLFGLVRLANDGVSILRACGVGGGSLVYSNITMRPPELIFKDERWRAVGWDRVERDRYYDLARQAIGRGVLHALDLQDNKPQPAPAPNTGLSNIVTRTAGLDPHWVVDADPLNAQRGRKRIDLTLMPPTQDAQHHLWIDRARLFQSAMAGLVEQGKADAYGAVDLAINDFDPMSPANQFDQQGNAKNYCERQGRCNMGCLPGARHTLNKQLMAAVLGQAGPPGGPSVPPVFPKGLIELWPLVEVDIVVKRPGGGYEIRFVRQDIEAYLHGERRRRRGSVTADFVILAAGCLGTNELLLRSKARETIPNLSPTVGFGFSTNGDCIAFMEKTKEHVSLIRGPIQTSFGHFNTTVDDPSQDQDRPDQPRFHSLEDQGLPPAFASLAGVGLPLIRSLSKGRHHALFLIWTITCFGVGLAWRRVRDTLTALFSSPFKRPDTFRSEEELTAKMMCVVGAGREAAIGRIRLGTGPGATPLRMRREDNKPFWGDAVYADIQRSIDRLAPAFQDPADPKTFMNPFLTRNVFGVLKINSITLSHPLGGCRIAEDGTRGVVDQYGRVFDTSTAGARGFHKGLFVADGSIIPTALGVNPSLTIATLALRIADQLIKEIDALPVP